MNASMMNTGDNQSRLKVSISTRLLAVLCYIIPALGGALSSYLLVGVFQALKSAENVGIGAVMGGVNEASLPVTISLYLAAFFGLVLLIVLVVRMIVETTTASPPIWFFAVGGILCLVPAALFWFAKYLTIEALSPGSSVVGAGGIGEVGAKIANVLLLSTFSAPVVVILLIVVAVLPLSSRSNAKLLPLAGATIIEILLIAFAVAVPFLIGEPKRKNELVKLPEVRSANRDYEIEKETSMVLALTADNKLYKIQNGDPSAEREKVITKEELPEKIKTAMRDKTPDRRIVYLKADANVSFENALQIFEIIRKSDIDKVGLVVIGEKTMDNPYQTSPLRFEVKLPQPIKIDEPVKPNPLTLVVMLDKDGRLMLNREDAGTISDTNRLTDKLTQIFKDREYNGVLREGTNEIVKDVFLKVSKSVKYGDFIKLVEAVKIASAQPIAIQLDDLNL